MHSNLTHRMKSLFDAARAVALSSPGCGPRNCYRVGAIIFIQGRIVTAKTNIIKTHAALARYTEWPVLHAETNAIISHGIDNCSYHSLLITRVHRNGTPTMSLPCSVCARFISMANFKRVYYTDWNGELKRYV